MVSYMDKLPVELVSEILEYLTPHELLSVQLVSKKFLLYSRENNLWRLHCYEGATTRRTGNSWTGSVQGVSSGNSSAPLSALGPSSLRSLIQGETNSEDATGAGASDRRDDKNKETDHINVGRRAEAADWDPSLPKEEVDWYSEYVARHASISLNWFESSYTRTKSGTRIRRDVKGMGLVRDWSSGGEDKVIGPLEDGSICIWDMNQSRAHGCEARRKKGKITGTSAPGILLTDTSRRSDFRSSSNSNSPEFIGAGECVSVDSLSRRAYVAVGSILNEVDPETLQVVSQDKYPWSIFALSQESDYSTPLTVGTTLGVHIYDSRVATSDRGDESSTLCNGTSSLPPPPKLAGLPPETGAPPFRPWSHWVSNDETDYAPLFQPNPLSVLHPPAPNVNTILLAGRFPSILTYDRRFFPRLLGTVYSGARLSGLASVTGPQLSSPTITGWPESQKVVACGEYNGRGSLELYNLQSDPTDSAPSTLPNATYRNRQSASSSKLLSLSSHQTRIVYSDSEGNLKWVERDGRTDVRRWNINTGPTHDIHNHSPRSSRYGSQHETRRRPNRHFEAYRAAIEANENNNDNGSHHRRPSTSTSLWSSFDPSSSSSIGGDVARKILTTGSELPNDELLIWTGDRIGRVRFVPECVSAYDEKKGYLDGSLSGDGIVDEESSVEREHREREREYSRVMRRALERQADEVRWMGRLGMRD
ncbi:hypothetical protein FQN54_004609 [Arachnomyces sp. PD_36]|nr:hypothetical protein FQN54_004609 [Arachnomyces sp. PD_36]